jgi:DNA primase
MKESLLEKLIGNEFHITGEGRWATTEEHDSLVIDRDRDIFFWNSKSIYGNAIDWLTKVKGYSYAKAVTSLGDADRIVLSNMVIEKISEDAPPIQPELVDLFWQDGKTSREYWYDRKLTDETIDLHKLGYHNGWYTLPIFVEGKFKNFQMRRDEPKKRILPYYRGVGPILVNSDILSYTDKVAITEGPVDALLLTQEGFPAVSHTGGSHGWRKEWHKYFIRQDSIYVIADNDAAGIEGAKKIAYNLGLYKVKILIFEGMPDRYDTVDFFKDGNTLDNFKDLVYNSSKYLFEIGDHNV